MRTAFSIALPSDNDPDDCLVCSDSVEPGWTCEDHADKPWRHSGCRGACAPCACNPRGAALWAMVYSDALRVAEVPALHWERSAARRVRGTVCEVSGLETSLG